MADMNLADLSSFGRLAVALDTDFSELTRLSGQIGRLEIESDGGLEHAVKLLNDFAGRAKFVTEGMLEFSKALEQTQAQAETAAKRVAERAGEIQARKERQGQIHGKLMRVQLNVKAVNDSLAGFRKPGKTEFSAEEKQQISTEFQRVGAQLADFIATTRAIKEEAAQAKFKGLERDAQALVDTLEFSRRKITQSLSGQ